MRHTYLRDQQKAYQTTLLFDSKLAAHLNEIDDSANVQMELLTKQTAKPKASPKHAKYTIKGR